MPQRRAVRSRSPPRNLCAAPLGYLWVGTKWFVTKLFVIRE